MPCPYNSQGPTARMRLDTPPARSILTPKKSRRTIHSMKTFKDKVAVVTGAASGIGRGIAERCVQEGMRVVLVDIEPTALERTAALGDTPFLEEALFYLAKAHLQAGDVTAARDALVKVILLNGDRAKEAQSLLDRLDALGGR